MHKNIKCDLNSVISTVYVTLNCMRRNTRQFRWIKILGANLHFVISSCLCHIELYKAQHPPVQMDKKIKCDLNSVISIVYVTLNCMRRNRSVQNADCSLHFVPGLQSAVCSLQSAFCTDRRRNTRQFRWIKILVRTYIL